MPKGLGYGKKGKSTQLKTKRKMRKMARRMKRGM